MKDLFSKEQCQTAIEQLNSTLPDRDVHNGVISQQFCNATITQDFTRKSIKRANVYGSKFQECNFSGAAASGSKFFDTALGKCQLKGANFQYCHFSNVNFCDQSIIQGCNFSHSVFIDCAFNSITIFESTLYDCYFENCLFTDSIIRTNTFENSTLCNCNIQNVDLAHINLEYIRLINMRMHNVILPPYQVPYIIGAPEYILHTTDEIYIYTDNGLASLKDYRNEFDNLSAYFFAQKQYFPLANILIAQGKNSLAYKYIRRGIQEACDYFDFRMIKYCCKLACASNFTPTQLKELYNLITDMSYKNSWDIPTLHSYMLNIGEIRELLLNNSDSQQRVDFIIKTNIDKDNLVDINTLYNQINSILKAHGSKAHVDAIELRHNSPYELYVTCIDVLPNILLIISTMYSIFTVGSKGIDFLQKIEDIIHTHKENKLLKYELEEKKLDIELKKIELSQAKERSSISTHTVVELEHILKCNSIDVAKTITPDYLHFKMSNPGRK